MQSRIVKVSHSRIPVGGQGSTDVVWALGLRTRRESVDGADRADRVACRAAGGAARGEMKLPFYSCRRIHELYRTYGAHDIEGGSTGVSMPNETVQVLYGAGWPCDYFGPKRQQNIMEGFVLLPSAATASAIQSSQLCCASDVMNLDTRVYSAHVYTSLMSESRLRDSLSGGACEDTFPTGQITFINIGKIRFLLSHYLNFPMVSSCQCFPNEGDSESCSRWCHAACGKCRCKPAWP